MKPDRERSPWLWLLLIPAQLVIVGLSFLGGVAIDSLIFSGGGDGQGHGAPIFSVLLPIITLIALAIVIIVALVGLTVGLVRRNKRRKAQAQQTMYPQYYCPPQCPPWENPTQPPPWDAEQPPPGSGGPF